MLVENHEFPSLKWYAFDVSGILKKKASSGNPYPKCTKLAKN